MGGIEDQNDTTVEDLLYTAVDKLREFQAGDGFSDYNTKALLGIFAAIKALEDRRNAYVRDSDWRAKYL